MRTARLRPLLKNGAENIKMVHPSAGFPAFAFFVAVIVKGAPPHGCCRAMIDYLQSAEASPSANYVGTVRFTNEDVKAGRQPSARQLFDRAGQPLNIDWLIANKSAMLEK